MAKQRQSAKSPAKSQRPAKPAARPAGGARKAAQAPSRKPAPRTAGTAGKAGKGAARAASGRSTKPGQAKPAAVRTPAKPAAKAPARQPTAKVQGKARVPAKDAANGQPAEAAAAPAPRKPGFYEAVAVYERGVQALQRHDFEGAAGYFRTVLDKYPGEQELLERARLYLRVCERETERRPAVPKTPAERVYAATVALNAGDQAGALDHLQRALGDDPESDHAHYMIAAVLGMRGRHDEALDHLRQAIALNPGNRGQAREDPDLEPLRGDQRFESILATPAAPGRRRANTRRP